MNYNFLRTLLQKMIIYCLLILQCSIAHAAMERMFNNDSTMKLFNAVETGDEQSLIEAIHDGADINATDDLGRTSMHWAILHAISSYGVTEAVSLLVNSGANIHVIDNNGETPLMIARRGRHTAIERYLVLVEFTQMHSTLQKNSSSKNAG